LYAIDVYINSCVEKNDEHLNLDMNFEQQMSPTLQVKGFWHCNSCLKLSKSSQFIE
jgi:hypothetical protein